MLLKFYRLNEETPESRSENCYYVQTLGQLTEKELGRLIWLLSETFEPEKFATSSFLTGMPCVAEVGPRLNFETAYSTTAKNICSAVEISKITRLEQSRRFGFQQKTDFTPAHDRMTDMIYSAPLADFGVPEL